MALFWSRKPKAEKNYDGGARGAKAAPAKSVKSAKSDRAGKVAIAEAAKSARQSELAKAAAPSVASGQFMNQASAIIRVRVTEKSGLLAQSGTYTFEVAKGATKHTVANAVNALYKVKPVRVSIMNQPARRVFVKGRHGTISAMKKALVTLKKGETIDFV